MIGRKELRRHLQYLHQALDAGFRQLHVEGYSLRREECALPALHVQFIYPFCVDDGAAVRTEEDLRVEQLFHRGQALHDIFLMAESSEM